jgi:hypothetical protein
MTAAAFLSQQGGFRYEAGHEHHVFQGTQRMREVPAYFIEKTLRLQKPFPAADQACIAPHASPEAIGGLKKNRFVRRITGPFLGFGVKPAGDRFQYPRTYACRICGKRSDPGNGFGDTMREHQAL